MLFKEDAYAQSTAYRIHGVTPEGGLLLRGVDHIDTTRREVMLFIREDTVAASADYSDLVQRAQGNPPPCPVFWHHIEPGPAAAVHGTSLVYVAEYSQMVGDWLLRLDYRGGDTVEVASASRTAWQEAQDGMLQRIGIAPDARWRCRPRQAVLDSVEVPVQRIL